MPIASWFSLDTTEKRLSRGEGSSPLQCSQEVVTLLCHKSMVMPNGQLGAFATKLLASRSDPACIKSYCGLIIKSFLASGPYIYLFLNFVWFLFVHFPGCQAPSKLTQPPAVSASPHTFILSAAQFWILCNRFPKEGNQTMVKLQKMENQPLKAEEFCCKQETRRTLWYNYRAELMAFHG